MKCPVCGSDEAEIMWGCAIQNHGAENEIVGRLWGCEECKSGGEIEYVKAGTRIYTKHGERVPNVS